MSAYIDIQSLAWTLQSLEVNFKASIIRHWTDFEAIANKYGCALQVTCGMQPGSVGGFRGKHHRDRMRFRRDFDTRNNSYLRGVAIDLSISRSNCANDIENVELDLVETICREIASGWEDEPIQWGGRFGNPLYFEWTAKVRRYEPPLPTIRNSIPQPPALGPLPTPWQTILTLLKRLLRMTSVNWHGECAERKLAHEK